MYVRASHMCSAYGGQKILDPLKLELQRVMGSMWVLRAGLGSSVRAGIAPSVIIIVSLVSSVSSPTHGLSKLPRLGYPEPA